MQPNNFEFWIDLNLPPSLAIWIVERHNILAKSFAELGFLEISDANVYKQAVNHPNIIIITTKDVDFIYLQDD